ncbi:MAG: electron transfer flavoprotein subunit beta/FixA family protein [Nitrososphaerota archaeon]|jgi:electron transfer flavoprotein beta subunit|nr:electron transfer flavoprotein subunit beta/FixA family protein [Nitrososphaerota archaeon]
MNIVVCIKVVIDPLLSSTDLMIDPVRSRIVARESGQQVVNGFDEQALEAALRLKDNIPGTVITLMSVGKQVPWDVLRKLMALDVDNALVIDGSAGDSHDPRVIAAILAAAVQRLEGVDLVICGRQASDWDNAQVPIRLAGNLGWPCLTLAREVKMVGKEIQVRRVLLDGWQDMSAKPPAVITVTSELGELRYPTMKGRLAAMKRQPNVWSISDLGNEFVEATELVEIQMIHHPKESNCHFIDGESGQSKGEQLAAVLMSSGLI